MNKDEARTVLAQQINLYRTKRYGELLYLLDTTDDLTVVAPSGQTYNIEIGAVWDDREQMNLRVMGRIDDGGWQKLVMPLCDDFIMRPDGGFVGE
jgi:hypothetical protein